MEPDHRTVRRGRSADGSAARQRPRSYCPSWISINGPGRGVQHIAARRWHDEYMSRTQQTRYDLERRPVDTGFW
jgi:hypothetical protein